MESQQLSSLPHDLGPFSRSRGGSVSRPLVWLHDLDGLAKSSDWPTVSDMLRSFMAFRAGRVLMFAMWLWLGWHLFIRHWEFFLKSPPPGA